MIKVFTLNKNGKIELTKKELEELLNESYWEGYWKNCSNTWTYHSPSTLTSPYTFTSTTASNATNVGNTITSDSITITTNAN